MTLSESLEQLVAVTDVEARLQTDPVRFVRRYEALEDQEVVAFFASQLAFGRVASFAAPLNAILAEANAHGGPSAWVRGFSEHRASVLHELNYRWIWPPDFVSITRALGAMLREAPFSHHFHGTSAREVLDRGVGRLAELAVPRTRGVRAFLARPAGGSACKRWCMFLRWMVRPDDGIDLGLWTHLDPAILVTPLDTHVHRIARLTRMTERRTANWRTAEEITAVLRQIDASDPVRFDFALAHLGISGACTATFDPEVCPDCALRALCREGTPRRRTRRRAARR
jgi:uncharacterized protein (TIGR02757 family)